MSERLGLASAYVSGVIVPYLQGAGGQKWSLQEPSIHYKMLSTLKYNIGHLSFALPSSLAPRGHHFHFIDSPVYYWLG